jgi:EAL domain-containing protein (putative c-di-GMP-specific phosphodiesterase class I)
MAKELNMTVIGEGIEEKETLEIFESEGGDIVQGYYFSKPLNEADFDKLLLQTN